MIHSNNFDVIFLVNQVGAPQNRLIPHMSGNIFFIILTLCKTGPIILFFHLFHHFKLLLNLLIDREL